MGEVILICLFIISTHIESTSSIMKRLLIITLSLILCSCGANYHLRRMEYHELKALAKGAKLKESVRTETDTIYRDTTIYVDGETLDETFSFVAITVYWFSCVSFQHEPSTQQ